MSAKQWWANRWRLVSSKNIIWFGRYFTLKIFQALAGERACFNTVQSFGNQLLFLGTKSCHIVSIRSWIERLDSLVDKACPNTRRKWSEYHASNLIRTFRVLFFIFWFKQGKFECALRLGIEFLEEKGKVVLGLRGRHQQRTNLVKNKVNVNLD